MSLLFDAVSLRFSEIVAVKKFAQRMKGQAHDLERFAANEKKKNENKIKKLKKTLEQSEHAKDFQLYGELLTANLYLFLFVCRETL